jgi:hypothetical protein
MTKMLRTGENRGRSSKERSEDGQAVLIIKTDDGQTPASVVLKIKALLGFVSQIAYMA